MAFNLKDSRRKQIYLWNLIKDVLLCISIFVESMNKHNDKAKLRKDIYIYVDILIGGILYLIDY